MQHKIAREQIQEKEARIGRERMKTPEQTTEKHALETSHPTAPQQLYAVKQMQEQQKQMAKQHLQQQKLYQQQLLLQHQHQQQQQQQQPQQQSIMKMSHKHAAHQYTGHSHAHPQHVHQQQLQPQQQQYFHSQYFPPVISPPEGFQSETPFDPVMDAEVEFARRLHAKAAQVYATEPRHRHHHEGKEKKKKSHRHQSSSPVVLDSTTITAAAPSNQDEGYELCIASDAELHTIGQHPAASSGTGTTNYFSLPRSHVHHRPASASPRNVQTLMRQPQSIYRRNEDYAYNYTA